MAVIFFLIIFNIQILYDLIFGTQTFFLVCGFSCSLFLSHPLRVEN